MPLGDLLHGVIQELIEGGVEALCRATGVMLVPLATFGRVRVDRRERAKSERRACKHNPSGPRLISPDTGAAIGLAFWIAVVAGAIAGFTWWPG
jgi:hypothetical protein